MIDYDKQSIWYKHFRKEKKQIKFDWSNELTGMVGMI